MASALVGLFVGITVGLAPASAQMPADAKFIQNIEKREYNELMTYLVNGGSPNVYDQDKVPALVVAARENDASMVRSILEYGARPDLYDRDNGETALMVGAGRGNEDIVQLLLFFKADIDQPDDGGETALIKAIRGGYVSIIRLLLEAGADPTLADYTGLEPRDHALRARSRRVVQAFDEAVAAR
ncbi:MAG: ankyrin repeat domain-containing protein [Alphaproteobacteria bacterium]